MTKKPQKVVEALNDPRYQSYGNQPRDDTRAIIWGDEQSGKPALALPQTCNDVYNSKNLEFKYKLPRDFLLESPGRYSNPRKYLYNLGVELEKNICDQMIDRMISVEDVVAQEKYYQSLTDQQRALIHLYTYNGDVALNSYIRDGYIVTPRTQEYIISKIETFSKFFDVKEGANGNKIMEDFLKYFYDSLTSIIANTPPITKIFMVYRGTYKYQYMSQYQKDEIYTADKSGILSTSLSIHAAINFAFEDQIVDARHSPGALTEIVIPPGSHVLLSIDAIFEEHEVLLPNNSSFYVVSPLKSIKLMPVKGQGARTMMVNQLILV